MIIHFFTSMFRLSFFLVPVLMIGCGKGLTYNEATDKAVEATSRRRLIEQGDMLFVEAKPKDNSKISVDAAFGFESGFASIERSGPTIPWPGGVIPVLFDATITEEKKSIFYLACSRWSEVANIRCIPATGEPLPLLVSEDPEYGYFCRSFVGKLQPGYFNVGRGDLGGAIFMGSPECWNLSTVIHEIGHTLGFAHEQDRPDQSQYLQLDPRLECQGSWPTNPKIPTDTPYDLLSVMHYPVSPSTGGEDCVQTRPEYDYLVPRIGEKDRPSLLDGIGMARIYGPSLNPIDRTVIGYVDGFVNQGQQTILTGWACARNTDVSIAVHLYARSPTGELVGLTGAGVANLPSEGAVNALCGTSAIPHRFQIDVSQYLIPFAGHSAFVFGISPSGGDNLPIQMSGESVFRDPTPPAPYFAGFDFGLPCVNVPSFGQLFEDEFNFGFGGCRSY